MNDNQENKLSMYLKLKGHLLANNATYTNITGYTALKNQLLTAIDNIFSYNAVIESDITGAAEEKANKRAILIEKIKRICNGLSGYAAVNDMPKLLRKVDFSNSDLSKMRDGILFTASSEVTLIPDEINDYPALLPFGVTPQDVDNLNTARDEYLASISEPSNEEENKTTYVNNLEKVFKATDDMLKLKLDYMNASLEFSFPFVWSNYIEARAIDDTGSISPPTYEGMAAPGGITPVALYPYNASRSFRFKNTGDTPVTFGLGINDLAIMPPGIVVAGGNQSIKLSSNLAPGGDHLLIQNTGITPVEYKIWVTE